jgi:DNA primase large subunit
VLLSRQELRTRFIKAESTLFRIRFETDAADERHAFLNSLNFDWQSVSDEEKNALREQLTAAAPYLTKNFESEVYFKVGCPMYDT